MRPSIRESILAALLVLVLGCSAYRGARLYASGTEALEHGHPAQAVADLEKAAELLPEASAVHNHLGLAYVRAGRDAEATGAFRRAVELDCGNRAAQHNLHAAEAGLFRPPDRSQAHAEAPTASDRRALDGP